MNEIKHNYIKTRGLNLHIAEIGSGPRVVIFVHGFPEIWYTWRHQMIAVANIGYRAIAPDLIGYGLSDPHPDLEKASFDDYVLDLLAILDTLGISKRVLGIVTVGVPFMPPSARKFHQLPEGFYISRWKELGQAEADFRRYDVKVVLQNIYILFSRIEIPIAEKDKEIMDLVEHSTPQPPRFKEDDLSNYTALYERSGLIGPLQVPYRSLRKEFTIVNPKIQVPTLVIMGGKDYYLKFPGVEDYIMSGKVKEYMLDLEITFLPEGTHFVQEQFPDQVNLLITTFLKNHT